MIVSFSVSNFLSFNEQVSFSMLSGKARKHSSRLYTHNGNKISKCKVFSGPNASGKSNLVKAIDYMRDCITEGLPRSFSNKYFRNIPENKNIPSSFEVTALINDIYITYGFSVVLSTGTIIKEYMFSTTKSGSIKHFFERNTDKSVFIVGNHFKKKQSINKLANYGDDSLDDKEILFINIMNHGKGKMYDENPELVVFKDFYRWFINGLTISYPGTMLSGYPYFKDTNLKEIADILQALDTGIKDLRIVDISPDVVKNDMPEELYNRIIMQLEKISSSQLSPAETYTILTKSEKNFYTFEVDNNNNIKITTIEFSHEKDEVYYTLNEESDGTARLLDLVEILIPKQTSSVYVIDEIDRCLHPSVTVKIVETFLELAESRNTQLIFTTHESRLFSSDILRNDEICFVTKDKNGCSHINSMESYKLRADKSIYAALFDGTIDAIPTFDDIKI